MIKFIWYFFQCLLEFGNDIVYVLELKCFVFKTMSVIVDLIVFFKEHKAQ